MSNTNPEPPSPTPFDQFRALVKRVVAVPKPEIDKREAEYKKQRNAKPEKHIVKSPI